MVIKKENAKWIPPLPPECQNGTNWHGWMNYDGEILEITNIHSYDDYGVSLETFTLERDGQKIELYSYDEGETFISDID